MFSPPWMELGRLQTEIDQLKTTLFQKAEKYEISTLRESISNLEHKITSISNEVVVYLYRIEILENEIRNLKEGNTNAL